MRKASPNGHVLYEPIYITFLGRRLVTQGLGRPWRRPLCGVEQVTAGRSPGVYAPHALAEE